MPHERPRVARAAILEQLRRPLVLDEIELPATLLPGQVLVRVHQSGICGSQLGEIDGVKGEDKYLPHLLGHEGTATVLEVGAGVTVAAPGDTVVLHWRKGRGIEAPPPTYRWRGRTLNAGWVTTFNSHAVVSENRMTPIPATVDAEIAALFGCAVTTGLGVVMNDAKLQIGESIVVVGTGGVGLNVVQGAALTAAHPIVAVDLVDLKLALARRLGATHTVNAGAGDLRSTVAKCLPGGVADVVVECTGNVDVIRAAYELTAPQGRTILVGVPRKGADITIHSLPLHFGKVLTGSHGGGAEPTRDIPRYLRLWQAGRLGLDEVITDRFRFEDINTAIDRVRSGAVAGRAMISFE